MAYSFSDPLRKEKLYSELNRTIKAILPLNPERVILFGSMNRGDINSHSDLDLLIIWKTTLPFIERSQVFYDAIQPNVAMDILVYTPDEIQALKDSNPFIHRALTEGRVVYEKGVPT